jgi:hypothetical protein
MKNNYKEKIKIYSALAGGLVLVNTNEAEAQVVYTNVNPDAVVNATTSTYNLDLNNDGTVDFQLRRTAGYYTYFRVTSTNYSNKAKNATTGATWMVGKLNLNDTISSTNVFNSTSLEWGKNSISGYGPWFGGATDKYIGVKFQISSVTYYGWIRVDVAADLSNMTIKDFAYESSPGALIKAGAMASVPMVTLVNGVDGADAGDASDLNIAFAKASDETNITKYRVFVAPATSGFNLDTAQMTAAASYFDIAKTGSNIAATCPSGLLDVNGNAIVNGTAYNVFVMSVGAASFDDALAVSASSVTLGTSVPVATNIVPVDNGNAGNASDMKITFDKASSETNIASYAIIVVPTASAGSVTLSSTQAAVSAGNYTSVPVTGSNLNVILASAAKDALGNAIVTGASYEVFVLSIASGAGNSDGLSAVSGPVTLLTPVPAATGIVAVDNGNAGNASDMKITFNKASSETNIASYAIIVVPTASAGSVTLSSAEAAVSAGNYTSVPVTGSNLNVVLASNAKDELGNAIVTGSSYEVFVLSIASGAGNSDSLSAVSGSVTLSNVTSIAASQNILSGIGFSENVLFLKNMPENGNVAVFSTSGAQVFSGSVSNGDNNYQLNNVAPGVYIVKVALLDNQVVSKKVYISGN